MVLGIWLGCSWQDGVLGTCWLAEEGLLHPGMCRVVMMHSSAFQGSVYAGMQMSLAGGWEKGTGGGHRLWVIERRLHGRYFVQERGGCSGRGMGTVSAWRQDKGSDFSLSLEKWGCWLEMLRREERQERMQSQESTWLAGQRDSFLLQDLLLSFSGSVPALSRPASHPRFPSPSCKSRDFWGPPGCPAQSWAQAPLL